MIFYFFPSLILLNYLFLFKECHKFSFGDVIQMRGLYSTEKCSLCFVHMSNLKDTVRKVSGVLWRIPSFFWLNRLKKNTNMLQFLRTSVLTPSFGLRKPWKTCQKNKRSLLTLLIIASTDSVYLSPCEIQTLWTWIVSYNTHTLKHRPS